MMIPMTNQLENKINPYESPQCYEEEGSMIKCLKKPKNIMRGSLIGGLACIAGGDSMHELDLSTLGYTILLASAIILTYKALKTRQSEQGVIDYE